MIRSLFFALFSSRFFSRFRRWQNKRRPIPYGIIFKGPILYSSQFVFVCVCVALSECFAFSRYGSVSVSVSLCVCMCVYIFSWIRLVCLILFCAQNSLLGSSILGQHHRVQRSFPQMFYCLGVQFTLLNCKLSKLY